MKDRFFLKTKTFRPPLLLSLFIAGAFSIAAIIIAAADWGQALPMALVYSIYVCAAVTLSSAVWQIILLVRSGSPKQTLWKAIHKTALSGRLYDDDAFRTVTVTYLSLGANLFFTVSKGVAGWYFASFWLISLAVYYLILCISKFILLRSNRKIGGIADERERLVEEWKAYRICGILLMLLTIVLQGMVVLIMRKGHSFIYHGTLIFVVALYDFYCLISAIVSMIRTRKTHSPMIVAVKSISFTTSLISMLSLQTAMFAAFGSQGSAETQNVMNLLTGSAVCLLVFLFSLFMVIRANQNINGLNS